nr:TERF1-interacting nuclear factor 2 isoform X1 [Anolis sagrei ordinatus]XP_060635955.1 TERF1-interacting nuclear factor 2 isoform X1 [Anolis sagrei ordinatus]
MGSVSVQEEEEEEEEPEGHDPFVALRLVAAASWHVVEERQVCDFPRVLAMLEAVGEAAPDLVHFRHLAKVQLGLQAKVIMTMLQNEESYGQIYEAVDAFFPEHNPTMAHPKATAEDLELVQAAQDNFRDLVLNLLSDRGERDKYVQEHLENDYGEAFSNVVEELFCDYLWQLESTLPKPDLEKLLEAVCFRGPRNNPQADLAILSRYFTVMGYQLVGITARLCTSNPPNPPRHSEGEDEVEEPSTPPELCKPPSSLGRSIVEQRCFPCPQEGDFQEHHSGSQETDDSMDMVLDSSSEQESSPFRKGEYQCTRHNTLIPTFQEHLWGPGSRCVRCLDSLTCPET